MSNIDSTLSERGDRYGSFDGHAEITQGLKSVMQCTDKWAFLADDQKEALEMIAHKIGRILNGDPNYIDNWHDIIGYTRLVEQRLEAEQKTARATLEEAAAAQNAAASAACAQQRRQEPVRSVAEAIAQFAQMHNADPSVRMHVMFIDEDPTA